jgi:hypothetical protein
MGSRKKLPQLETPDLMLYKTLNQTVTYIWVDALSEKDGNMLRILGRIFRIMYGPVNDDGIWRTSYKNELHTL